jgi:hypothetical protein
MGKKINCEMKERKQPSVGNKVMESSTELQGNKVITMLYDEYIFVLIIYRSFACA